MTETDTAPATSTLVPADTAKAVIKALGDKNVSVADIVAMLDEGSMVEAPEPPKRSLVPPTITDEQREALKRLPELYGRVVPEEPRLLEPAELTMIVQERQTIATLLDLLEPRKADTIRETLACHLDLLLEADPEVDTSTLPRDKKGHYAVASEVSVEGTGLKVKRVPTGGKPFMSDADIQAADMSGDLDHKDYLAITSKPVVAPPRRRFDEEKARAAIKKDPALLFRLASLTHKGEYGTTITVPKDN